MTVNEKNKLQENARCELFVKNIPMDASAEDLELFFSNFAPVKHAVIVRDSTTKLSKGFGFVSFASAKDAVKARKASKDRKMNGRNLVLDFAKPRNRQKDDGIQAKAYDHEEEHRWPRIIVRNLPISLKSLEVLSKYFKNYGEVVNAYYPKSGSNTKRFAFITMRKKGDALNAIEHLNDLELEGNKLNVALALQKHEYEKTKIKADIGATPLNSKEQAMSNSEEDEKIDDIPHINSETEILSERTEGDTTNVNGNDQDGSVYRTRKDSHHRPALTNDHTVFLRNVPYDATQEDLEEHFSQFGPVAYALIVMDKNLKQPKGTAFVAFDNAEDCDKCVSNAPKVSSSSLLVPDNVDDRYVFEGRVLSVTKAVDRQKASALAKVSEQERLEKFGRGLKVKDKRNLYLLNEGRVLPNSKLAEALSQADMDMRNKSYQLRKQQLSSNPTLHMSMTRLALRNIPKCMDNKCLKALGRKAVVSFAREVKVKLRQPLSKEEVLRSVKYQGSLGDLAKGKHGVVRQAKVMPETKPHSIGQNKGYGFLEMRNHKAALMALRWLNGHVVTDEELGELVKQAPIDEKRKRLIVEFAIENVKVLKRHQSRQLKFKTDGGNLANTVKQAELPKAHKRKLSDGDLDEVASEKKTLRGKKLDSCKDNRRRKRTRHD